MRDQQRPGKTAFSFRGTPLPHIFGNHKNVGDPLIPVYYHLRLAISLGSRCQLDVRGHRKTLNVSVRAHTNSQRRGTPIVASARLAEMP